MTNQDIVKLRKMTGAGMLDCKNALEEANGDFDQAADILRKKGIAKAAKKADRDASEGVIGTYVHSNNKVAAMVQLACETDFVARTEDFQSLAADLAMHVAAENPLYLTREDVPKEVIEKEQEIFREQLEAEAKPEDIVNKIIEGKLNKYFEEICLLEQKFIKDDSNSIADLINAKIGTLGEKIEIQQYTRLSF